MVWMLDDPNTQRTHPTSDEEEHVGRWENNHPWFLYDILIAMGEYRYSRDTWYNMILLAYHLTEPYRRSGKHCPVTVFIWNL